VKTLGSEKFFLRRPFKCADLTAASYCY
ncbi:uncharacterized protein METZ01_LOCUS204079, partial [marine metagenome]